MNLLEQFDQMENKLESDQETIWKKYVTAKGEEKGKILQKMAEIEGQLNMLDKIKGLFEEQIDLLGEINSELEDFMDLQLQLDECDWISLEPLNADEPNGYKVLHFQCCVDGDEQVLTACDKCNLCKNCYTYDAAITAESLANVYFQNSIKEGKNVKKTGTR